MRCPISFHTRRAAFAAIFAERALFKRERRRGNVAYDGGFAILRDTQMPIIDAVALLDRARRPAAEMACSAGEVL